MKNLLLTQFDLHQLLYNNVLEGFTDEETNDRMYDDANINHVKYLAGHLLNSRYGLAKIAGVEPIVRWNDLFAVMGASHAKDNHTYPHIGEIKKEWNGLYDKSRNGLAKLGSAELEKIPPEPFDQVAETVGDLWAFINHHQAYHIGQIGILRRGFGKEPMSYQ